MRWTTAALALVPALALVAPAQAGLGDLTIEYAQLFSGELSPFAQTLTFDQFQPPPDAPAGTIFVAVVLEIEATVSAMVTAENDGQEPAPNFGIQLTGFVTAQGPSGLSVGANASANASSGGVGASDGVSGSGPDFFDFGLIGDDVASDDILIKGIDDLVPYEGTGTVDILVEAQGGFSVTGAANSTIDISDFMVEGEVRLTYIYFYPSPGAGGLALLAGGWSMRRRR